MIAIRKYAIFCGKAEADISYINDPNIRDQARALLLKVRVFRFFAMFFAAIGGGIFLIFYLQNMDGQLRTALTQPRTIWMIVVPFLPAVIFSYIAEKVNTSFWNLLKTGSAGGKGKKKNKK